MLVHFQSIHSISILFKQGLILVFVYVQLSLISTFDDRVLICMCVRKWAWAEPIVILFICQAHHGMSNAPKEARGLFLTAYAWNPQLYMF